MSRNAKWWNWTIAKTRLSVTSARRMPAERIATPAAWRRREPISFVAEQTVGPISSGPN
jgi:hypothetical protein